MAIEHVLPFPPGMAEALARLRLSGAAHNVIWHCLTETYGRAREDFETSTTHIAAAIHARRETTSRALAELVAAGVLEIGHRVQGARRFKVGWRNEWLSWPQLALPFDAATTSASYPHSYPQRPRLVLITSPIPASRPPPGPGVVTDSSQLRAHFREDVTDSSQLSARKRRKSLRRPDFRHSASALVCLSVKKEESGIGAASPAAWPGSGLAASLVAMLARHPRFVPERDAAAVARSLALTEGPPGRLEAVLAIVDAVLSANLESGRAEEIKNPVGWLIAAIRTRQKEQRRGEGERVPQTAIDTA